ncbi:MAG TPA: glycine cleavage system protein H [Spirochaetota bacterium]|jgi:glycine cleavage system H protein|nr:glycine cleavage system protein H [Spirochaetota bacterium]OQB00519.1 MAG: Glycine cleavage system H protein [Spirochaetes bacterium ADurb.Bin218]HOK01117.1 glycine cleavage system protein H [Spirochaetota bacterium]HOK91442.1 glycine cleavage system protein H [Spirochaetota bacterium]HON14948.1 glycine cleavage system protein H [Spirochaetota bacterium]
MAFERFDDTVLFTYEHIWLKKVDYGIFRCGITFHIAELLGEIISAEFIKNIIGMEIYQNDAIATIESLRDVIEIKSPLHGTITNINREIYDNPVIINEDPHGDGWLFEIEPIDGRFLDVISEEEYIDFVNKMKIEE